jgi:ribosomal protein S14
MNKVPREKKYGKPRKGEGKRYCQFCKRMDGLVQKYGLQMCRQCFKKRAPALGFKKYG